MAVGPYGALLDAVRGVRWPARRPVPGGAPGAHRARTRGVATEFIEYRPYRQGDDPRRLDWKLLARSDKAFIRLAPDHAVLGTTFFVDASASMAFPVETGGKWLVARRVVVALAAVAHAGSDPIGLVVVSGRGVRRLEPRSRSGVVAELAQTLDETVPGESAPLSPHLRVSASRCVVVTDCLGDFDALRSALARHRARGGEVHLIHVIARRELDPPPAAMMAVDPEDVALERPLIPSTRDGYLESFARWRANVAAALRADGVAYHELVDDVPVEALVRRIVQPQQKEVTR